MTGQDPAQQRRASEERWERAAQALREATRVASHGTGSGSGMDSGNSSNGDWGDPAHRPAQGSGDRPGPGGGSPSPDADPEFVARAIVLRQLSMAPRSRAQLERKLRQRGCDEAVARRVLDRMEQVGLVDDEAYADVFVRSRHTERGLATPALRHELLQAGVDREVADAALQELGSGQERERAEQLVTRRLRTMAGLAPEVKARRLAGMLARKGYSGEIAWPVIRDALDREPEQQRD